MPRAVEYPIAGVELVKDLGIPTESGMMLAADLYKPVGADRPLPLVMEYIPYRKDDVPPRGRYYEALVESGYVVARVDVRGTGGSEGASTDEYLEIEQRDGYDAVEWLAAQPFCDGHVCIMGSSYGGFTALQIAALNPPHLTCIVPAYFTDDRYRDDCHYVGGLLRMYYDPAFYGNFMVAYNAMPPDPDCPDRDWAGLWEEHLRRNEPYILEWLRHQTDGSYWRNGSVGHVAERIRCPVFMIGGWRDGYVNPPGRLWQKLKVPRRMLIGPWNHEHPHVAIPGPRVDYLREVVRWLDHWCKGERSDVLEDAPVVVYMQRYDPPDPDRLDTSGEWRAERSWPPPGVEERAFYLGTGGRLESSSGAAGADRLEYMPTVGSKAGLWSGGVPLGLAGDQREDEALSLVYTTAPLEADVHVLGNPRVDLHVSSTAAVIGFFVKLTEVGPDGASHLVAKGALNVTRRASLTEPQPLEPNVPIELEIPIDATGWIFSKGNRIRVAISNADFPNVWPTPQLATSQVFWGADRPSRLVLPVVPAAGSAPAPTPSPSSATVSRRRDVTPRPRWEFIDDALTGAKTMQMEFVWAGDEVFAETRVDPRDPARASASGRFTMRRMMGGHEIENVSQVRIQGTSTHFHIAVTLEVSVNGMRHAARGWVESVPRQLL